MDVVVIINAFNNVDLSHVVESLRNIGITHESVRIVLSWSNPPPNALSIVNSLKEALGNAFDITYLPLPKMGSGKQRDLTLRFVLASFPNTRYIVYMEDDVVINDRGWLNRLIEIFDKLPSRVAAISLEPGSRLCVDFVVTNIVTDRGLYVGLSGGSGVYIIRADVLRELLSLGIGTYSPFMYFHWEDMEFVLKLWFMGYVTVSYRGINYIHLGTTSRRKPLHRRYTEYLGPLMAMLINAPTSFLVMGFLVRIFRDVVRAIVNNDLLLLFRAYYFLVKNLDTILAHRALRARIYKDQSIFTKILINCIK